MAIDSKIPEITILKESIAKTFGRPLYVHSDFEQLREDIFSTLKEQVSESTLERIWGYSTRGSETVSRRILDVLCAYIGAGNWDNFVQSLKEKDGSESDFFDSELIKSADLQPGAKLRIGWPPDRICIIRYTGHNRYVAEEALNAKLKPGDTFSCIQFQLHSPVYLSDLRDADGSLKGASYGIGLRHGLTILQQLPTLPVL